MTRRAWLVDGAAVFLVLALVPVVHSLGPMLRAAFWLDESWVAMSVRASFRQALDVTGPTPVGWTMLMRLVPGDDPERLRWVTIAFLAASVPAGYALGRLLGWDRRVYAVLAGLGGAAGALLLPAQQVRHDLKQYTADGAVAVALLALAAWTESRWSYRRLAIFAGCAVLAMFFSHPALLVGGAALGSFLLVALIRRAWKDLLKAGITVVAGGLVMLLVYINVSRRGQLESLETYWQGYFLSFDEGPSLGEYLRLRLDGLGHLFGVPWVVFMIAAAAGVATMFVTRRPVAGAATLLLPIGVIVAGYMHAYPVLDQRTSHFLLVTLAVSAGIGVVGAARLIAWLVGRWVRGWQPVVAGALAAATVAAFVVVNAGWLRYYAPPGIYPRDPVAYAVDSMRYDIRDQVRYVEEHRRPGDVVLVNSWGNFGFAYYWRPDRPRFVRDENFGNGWAARYDESARIVIAGGRGWRSVQNAVAQAERLLGPGGRVWLIRTHLAGTEIGAWRGALSTRQVEWIRVGPEHLGVFSPPRPTPVASSN